MRFWKEIFVDHHCVAESLNGTNYDERSILEWNHWKTEATAFWIHGFLLGSGREEKL